MKKLILSLFCLSAIVMSGTAQTGKTELASARQAGKSGVLKALYQRPQGTYFFGLGLSSAMTRGYFVPAYTPMTFRNLSENAIAYNWTSRGEDGTEYISSTAEEPVVTLPYAVMPTPTLTVRSSDNERVSYTYGKMEHEEEASRMGQIAAGGWNEAINVNRVDNYVSTLTMPGDWEDYVFGTSKQVDVHAIGNYFEKPLQQCIVRSAYITFGEDCLQMDTAALVASGDTTLYLRAIEVERVGDELVMKDTISTAVASVLDVMDLTFTLGYRCYFLPFRFPEPLVVDCEMYYELSNFNGNEHIVFGIQSNELSDSFEENAYVRIKDKDGSMRLLCSSDYTRLLTGYTSFKASLMFGLDMMFPVCHANMEVIDCDAEGGNIAVDFETTFAQDTPNEEDTYPLSFSIDCDWAEIEAVEYDGIHFGRTVRICYEPLPGDVSSRTAKLVVKAFAMPDQVIELRQGKAGVAANGDNRINVCRHGEGWQAVYPAGYVEAELMNLSGMVFGKYRLSAEGVSYISAENLPDGLYLLVFRSDKGIVTRKIVK